MTNKQLSLFAMASKDIPNASKDAPNASKDASKVPKKKRVAKAPRAKNPSSPGEILFYGFLVPHRMTFGTLASLLNSSGSISECSSSDILEMINNRLRVTPTIAKELGRIFNMSQGFWVNAQETWDSYVERTGKVGKTLAVSQGDCEFFKRGWEIGKNDLETLYHLQLTIENGYEIVVEQNEKISHLEMDEQTYRFKKKDDGNGRVRRLVDPKRTRKGEDALGDGE